MKNNCYLFFETLGTRLKIDILSLLRKRPLSVNDLSEILGEERSKVSHALLSLLDCGFVHVKKDGKKRIYSINDETILPLWNLLEKHIMKYCKVCVRSR